MESLPRRCSNTAAGTQFIRNSISEVGHWFWPICPGVQSAFQFIPKVFGGVEVRALCRPVKFFHTELNKPFLYGTRFVHRGIVLLKQDRIFPKLLSQSCSRVQSSRMALCAVALRFIFTGTTGPGKTAPDHYSSSTKLDSWHYAMGKVAFSWHLPNPDSSVGLPDGEVWFITPENAFSLLQSPSFTPLQLTLGIAHGYLRLVCVCSQRAVLEQFLCWRCFQMPFGTRVCCNQGQTIFTRFSTRRSRSVSLCGQQIRGWAVVASRYFHFTITALTVDRGSTSRADIWRTDLLERWNPMTVSCWKSLSSSVRPFYCQCLSMEIACLCARFYTAVSHGCGLTSRIH